MRKAGRKANCARIREIRYICPDTMEVHSYPLDENGCHILKMKRAKRTNYKASNKNRELTDSTPASDSTQTDESPIVSDIEDNKKIIIRDIDLVDPLHFQNSITDTYTNNFSIIEPENSTILYETNQKRFIDIDLTFDKFEDITPNNQCDISTLKLF